MARAVPTGLAGNHGWATCPRITKLGCDGQTENGGTAGGAVLLTGMAAVWARCEPHHRKSADRKFTGSEDYDRAVFDTRMRSLTRLPSTRLPGRDQGDTCGLVSGRQATNRRLISVQSAGWRTSTVAIARPRKSSFTDGLEPDRAPRVLPQFSAGANAHHGAAAPRLRLGQPQASGATALKTKSRSAGAGQRPDPLTARFEQGFVRHDSDSRSISSVNLAADPAWRGEAVAPSVSARPFLLCACASHLQPARTVAVTS
jgi:hypothetical protein